MSPYLVYMFGIVTGSGCTMMLLWIWASLFNRKEDAHRRAVSQKFDAEILSRWMQLDVIRREAKKSGFEFVESKEKA